MAGRSKDGGVSIEVEQGHESFRLEEEVLAVVYELIVPIRRVELGDRGAGMAPPNGRGKVAVSVESEWGLKKGVRR